MPAAAVIPAPIAYIKVVAVKKLVVGFLACAGWSARQVCTGTRLPSFWRTCCSSLGVLRIRTFTLKKLECLKQAYA